MPVETPLLAREVRVTFGDVTALDGLDLRADSGAITALLGPNGAGKTTFIRCCTGLVRPRAGSIEIFGHEPGSNEVLPRVGLMPQRTGAWSGITARELLPYLASLYANPQPVDDLVELFGIRPFLNTTYRNLSGGQQQAVNLAAALIGRPGLVFLDEPTAGLDVRQKRQTWAVLRQIRDAGVAIVLTTHDMREAGELADRVSIIDHGRISMSGTVEELTADADLETVFLTHTSGGIA